MIALILLLASSAWGQSTATVSAPLIDQIEISNLGKDTRDLLSGRYRQTGRPTFAGGICFADGTCQTTAPVAASIPASSTTMHAIAAVGPITNSSLFECVANSTLSITNAATNERIRYEFIGNIKSDTGGASPFCSILVNGAFPSGYTATAGTKLMYHTTAATFLDFNYSFTTERLSGTSFSVCLACASTGGTGNWYLGGNRLRAGLYEVP